MDDFKELAWLITETNDSTLSILSGMKRETFKANTGWVLFRDYRGRFNIIPSGVFNTKYGQDVELKEIN